MLSRVYQQMYKLPEHQIIGFDNFHSMNRKIPRIFFTHDNYIKDYTGDFETKKPFYDKAVVIVAETRQASISGIQRRLKIGYNRAARMVERMEQEGVVGPSRGAKPREVFVNKA